MSHTLGYRINNINNGVYFSYVENITVLEDIWVYGVNAFHSDNEFREVYGEGDIYENSPSYVRVDGSDDYIYFVKYLIFPENIEDIVLSVIVDGSESNNSFNIENESGFLVMERLRNNIRIVSNENTTTIERNGRITIKHSLDASVRIDILTIQDPCEYGLTINSVKFNDCNNTEIPIIVEDEHHFQYTFNTLLPQTACSSETLDIEISSNAPGGRFKIESIKEYFMVGSTDDPALNVSFNPLDGEYYIQTSRIDRDGNIVLYQRKVIVINGKVYLIRPFNNGVDIKVKNITHIGITNYGKSFLEDDCFYEILLFNPEDRSKRVIIEIHYI